MRVKWAMSTVVTNLRTKWMNLLVPNMCASLLALWPETDRSVGQGRQAARLAEGQGSQRQIDRLTGQWSRHRRQAARPAQEWQIFGAMDHIGSATVF